METTKHTKNVRGEIILSKINIYCVQLGSGGSKVRVAEGTIAVHCVKRDSSYRYTDFTSNLMKKVSSASEIA